MRGLVTIGSLLGGALLCGFATPPAPATAFDLWKTGPGSLSYHRLQGDCDTLTHSFGRNAAWGYWVMPRTAIDVALSEEDGAGPARLVFSCRDGSGCIKAGALGRTPDSLASHTLTFGSTERARLFERAITDTGEACKAS